MKLQILNVKLLIQTLVVTAFLFSSFACQKKKEEEVVVNCVVMGNYSNGCGTLNLSGSVTTLASGFNGPYGLTTDKSYIYVNDTGNVVIKKVDIGTGSTSTLVNSGVANLDAITFDGTDLYTESNVTSIKKIVIATSTVTTLNTSGSAYDITTDGTNLYVAAGSILRQVEISTGVATTLATSGSMTIDTLTYDGTDFYAGHTPGMFGSAVIKKITKAGVITDFITTGLSGVTAMTCDGTYLYFTDNSALKKAEIATGTVTTLIASGFGNAHAMTTDGTALYIANGNNIDKVQ